VTFEIYVVIDPKGDRPYVSTTPPTRERVAALVEQGCRVFSLTAILPGESPFLETAGLSVGKPFPVA
jgi:hypothetical protein